MSMRIGFYVCHCGINIAGKVRVEEVAAFARELRNVVIARDYKFMCSDPGQEMIEKEMVLVKFPITEDLNNISVLANAYNGKLVIVGTVTIIVMIADEPKRVEHFLTAIRRYHPLEIVRGGTVAVDR